MIQTKEELFLAELGINTKEEIELDYGAKIKITDLLKKYETKQLLIHSVVQQREQLFCEKVIHHTCKWFDQYNGCMGCLVKKYEAK